MRPDFAKKLKDASLWPLKPTRIDIFQMNVGKMCNQTCHHCHVEAGPHRREIMTKETMQLCVDLVRQHRFPTVDITGGAPELNPNFRWLVESMRAAGAKVMDRCNLTVILSNPKYRDLPEFFRDHQVEVVSSLPHFSASRTNRQRGDGVFEKSIEALRLLNQVGYGRAGSGLVLNLVYNPAGCFLPGDQAGLEREFKRQLKSNFDIEFNSLFCLTNMPIRRYLDYLQKSGNYESYMNTLVESFNAVAAAGVMCRNTLSIGWDGTIYDCDFNQMLDLTVQSTSAHVKDFDLEALRKREIVVGEHCYGCTAGSGSSCGGATV
ncbi:MAG: arsenosugar biosynthesis radical SAM (seleno)protein ArsS [Bdellovibrionales bacterium]